MRSSPKRVQYGVRWYYSGQIGNQMFHYCMAKILAEKRGLSFIPPRFFSDKAGRPVRWSGKTLFKQRSTNGLVYPRQNEFSFGAYNWYDMDSLPEGRALRCNHGWWCRYELYRDWKDKIRNKWLKIPDDCFVATDPHAVYVHVRRTDTLGTPKADYQTRAMTLDEFGRCLDLVQYNKIVIATDDVKDPFLRGFNKFGVPVEVLGGTWDQDFLALASCRQMIMSCSTYSWWAGYLGRAEKIYCPIAPDSGWGRGIGLFGADQEIFPNLYVDDEPERWKWVL